MSRQDHVFKVKIPAGGTATWTLHGHRQAVASVSSPSCCVGQVPVPQDGNGLGILIAPAMAGGCGLVMVLKSPKIDKVRFRDGTPS